MICVNYDGDNGDRSVNSFGWEIWRDDEGLVESVVEERKRIAFVFKDGVSRDGNGEKQLSSHVLYMSGLGVRYVRNCPLEALGCMVGFLLDSAGR